MFHFIVIPITWVVFLLFNHISINCICTWIWSTAWKKTWHQTTSKHLEINKIYKIIHKEVVIVTYLCEKFSTGYYFVLLSYLNRNYRNIFPIQYSSLNNIHLHWYSSFNIKHRHVLYLTCSIYFPVTLSILNTDSIRSGTGVESNARFIEWMQTIHSPICLCLWNKYFSEVFELHSETIFPQNSIMAFTLFEYRFYIGMSNEISSKKFAIWNICWMLWPENDILSLNTVEIFIIFSKYFLINSLVNFCKSRHWKILQFTHNRDVFKRIFLKEIKSMHLLSSFVFNIWRYWDKNFSLRKTVY